MRVKCLINCITDVRSPQLFKRLSDSIRQDTPIFDLEIGKTYPVQAMQLWNDGGWRVYLHTTPESHFPYPLPLEFFSIVDAALPNNWSVKIEPAENAPHSLKRFAFAEWAENEIFYERLVDGDAAALKVYAANRRI